ncbi:lytic transglycosylase domain-containing protein [Nonlabens mediterrranea]|uniref:Lytic transglycosylase domain-containing protein n=1 Tax=Nonlabens mediterrranea TaxID=1419947 RepID=A0ABS0A3V7_9FLAO|nr:lytic transglycosylase domain-containing protein [Nonlabens mediterrranea]
MKKILLGAGIVVVLLLAVSAVQQNSSLQEMEPMKTTELKDPSRVGDYGVYALDLPKTLDFAGESVPLHNPDIKERADREFLVNTYWQSNGIMLVKKSKKYFPIIEPILAEEGIPDDFKYLAVIESGLDNVKSPAGASGFWQIMSATGKELNLEVNSNVDERYHLEKATRAACKYLKDSKERMGTWTLAAAAYNAGNAGVNRELERQQATSYYDLLLGQETGRYVFRILALKEILKNPESFGFNIEPEQYYYQVPTKKILVDYEIDDLAAFAKANSINYKILKIHNPWLRENKLNNKSGKLYEIEIPENGYYD